MEGVLLPICAIIFSGLLCAVFFIKKRIPLIENSVYAVMLISVLFDSILVSIIQAITIYEQGQVSLILLNFINKLDFAFLIAFSNCLFLYTLLITIPSSKEKINKLIYGIIITDFLLYIPIAFGKIELISENNNYSITGLPTVITYIICGSYLVSSVLITIVNLKNITKRHIPILSIIIFSFFLFLIFRINPYLIIISITLTLFNYIMYFTIQNPDVSLIKKLELAREQADKANNAKTDFLSSMSHEIRTPLNAIAGFSNCIMSAKDLGEAKENAQDIINASDTLLEIVNGILDISKIEAGKLEIINSNYDSHELFLELAKLITPKMNEKGLDFTYNIASDIPPNLIGDHANLKKVITNLLSNACKYTDKGYVHYEVNCVNSIDATKLIITVEDSGRGIKKESIEKLFTKFQRLDEDKNTTIEGTGLGLAITKQLVELMGGKIIVHTVYGEGSKFTVVLNQKIDKEPIKKNNINTDSLNLTGVRILLVDDTELNLKVATKLLENYKANHVVQCRSGYECIEKIKRGESYDVILLDIMMPKMDGVETLKHLKEIENFNIPTIALTADAISGMKEKYLNEGFDDYLAKPIEKDELIRVLNKILKIPYDEPVLTTNNDLTNTQIIRGEEILTPDYFGIDRNKSQDEDKAEILDFVEETKEELDTEPTLIPVVDINIPTYKEKYDEKYLEDNGVDLNHAKELLGDMEMYNMTITDFYNEVSDKWQRIIDNKNNNNMKDYSIDVHSLKSDCKYLGFMKLADIAYNHELKSKENNIEFVNNNFQELENEYQKVLEITKNYVENLPK